MNKFAIICIVMCCLMSLGCGSKNSADAIELSQNNANDEAICRDVINAYLSQKFSFDNNKIHELNCHIVELDNVVKIKVVNTLDGKQFDKLPFNTDLFLDYAINKEDMRDYISNEILLPTIVSGNRKMFTRSQGKEIADWYIKLYSLTEFDIQNDDYVKDKKRCIEGFNIALNEETSGKIFSFKVTIKHVDFNAINNQIVKQVIDDFIKDPEIKLYNERIKSGKTAPPNTLVEFVHNIDFDKSKNNKGTDFKYATNKLKQIFIDVLKANADNPPMLNDDFYICICSKPISIRDSDSKAFLVIAGDQNSLDKVFSYENPLADKALPEKPFLFTEVDKRMGKKFLGNISKPSGKVSEDILFEAFTFKKDSPRDLNISINVSDVQLVKGNYFDSDYVERNSPNKNYYIKVVMSNNSSEYLIFNKEHFKIINEYDNGIGEVNGFKKSDYDKFTDDELKMLKGEKPIPPKKTFEFTLYISLNKKLLAESDEIWLVYDKIENKINLQTENHGSIK